MANLITALINLGPKLVHGRTIALQELAEWAAKRSGLTSEGVERVRKAVRSALVHYGRGGAAVRLPGFGRIRPTIDREGQVRVRIVPDPELDRALGIRGAYRGEILNRANMGLSDAELKLLWNVEEPEDPLDLRRAS